MIAKCYRCGNPATHRLNNGSDVCAKNAGACPVVIEQRKQNNIKKYGVDNPSKLQNIKDVISEKNTQLSTQALEQRRKTCQEKYGTDYVMQVGDFKERLRESHLSRNQADVDTSNEKRKETNREKYGGDAPYCDPLIAEKIKKTKIEKYGNTINGFGSCKYKSTMLEKYGVENPSHSKEIIEKITKGQYRTKEYIFPSGKVVKVQGYEHYALNDLLEIYTENEIVTETKLIPRISYIDSNAKSRYYFPDIFIPKDNLIIEVKSDYTYNINVELNQQKKHACIVAGYNFRFMIYD